jgi:hypothetical protein
MSPLIGAALGAAISALTGMHPHVAKDEIDTAKLKSSPSYVLLQARHLLRHRET